ncbi:alpha/beta hydrolase [Streptomyces pluripotens]|uniref:Alpha/beta hydrolase n=1 Tax=Streptomyces pluripotens TaxID=1355015 RepID=A0A221P3T5_9ACTN|nr:MULTISPECIES: alpha/beta hydrolase [Streptomyces]ARP72467.1 hydrolase [Streptomyces pluripotens]ASN26718.1 alpha/beta hydrolase [Streptomyces pluripotens]KIE26111.1 hydrolase [Streptomyces sp. MUSC 125]MCH0559560.1 alpha/beta hydrolase [Streptomyces sp. MUM 16J]
MDEMTTSRDGTRLAYDVIGQGPMVILVSGALSTGGTMMPLATRLSDRCTAVVYDRRGRGESGDTRPYAVAREVEDLAALVDAVGGEAALFGVSSGGALVLEAAASGVPVRQAAVYEVPFADFLEGGAEREARYKEQLGQALAEGRPGEAVELFLRLTGLGEEVIRGARQSPMWAGLEAVAPSLAHDDAVMGDGLLPRERVAAISVPVLSVAGGASPGFMREASRAIAEAVPLGTHRVLEGQTHMVEPEVLGPVLTDFFTG